MVTRKSTTAKRANPGSPRAEAKVSVGTGGEWHQTATSDQTGLTTNQGLEPDGSVVPIRTLKPFIAAAKTRQWDREATLRTLA